MSGGITFSVLDIKDAYLQIKINKKCRNLLTINTHKSLYQYKRLPFGLTSAPAIWQKFMDNILSKCKMTACYLDDIIITGRTEQEHTKNLLQVLQCLSKTGIKLNQDKCYFYKNSVNYCGHEISKDGLKKTNQLIEAVLEAPRPKSVTDVRAFCGLAGYYRDFIPNLSSIQKPLMDLTTKNKTWTWLEEHEKAFAQIKKLIAKDVTLTHFDLKKEIILSTDASACGLGAILSHVIQSKEKPIAFASRVLKDAEKNYLTIEREALAVKWGVEKFKQYLEGRFFTVYTDHKPLLTLLNQKNGIPTKVSPRIQRWAIFLQGFNFKIIYKPGIHNQNADALSRLPYQSIIEEKTYDNCYKSFQINLISSLNLNQNVIQEAMKNDKNLQTLYNSISQNLLVKNWPHEIKAYQPFANELLINNQCVYRGNRVIIPEPNKTQVLQMLHKSHLGMVKTKSLARDLI